ncbi:MAG: aminoglycoside phosphotransferase family protein [Chloroflexi bacterium]|nr:aminoglycoside phosphotransferase family protein [Chloroflexota bacterium]
MTVTMAFVDLLASYLSSLRSGNGPLLSAPLHWTILTNGGMDPHDCIILFLFEAQHSRPSLVAKIPRLPEDGRALQVEYERMTEVWGLLGDEAVFRIPRPIAMLNLEGQPALVLSYLPGESLLRASKRMVWEQPQQVYSLAVDAGKSLREVMDRIATPLAHGERVPTDFLQKVEKFRAMYSLTEREEGALQDLMGCLASLEGRATHKVLIQGDFWHGNMIRNSDHGRLMFVDWQYSHWATDVSLDVYLFLLAGALADTPQASVEDRARGAVEALVRWRPKIIPAYLQAFGKPAHYTLLPVRQGMLLCCVEKAVRASMDAGFDLTNDLIWRHYFSELLHLPEGNAFYDGLE